MVIHKNFPVINNIRIEKEQESFEIFQKLPETLKEELIAFCMGNRGAKVTYDPFFKYVFHPSLKKGRLAELLSLILGIKNF